MSDRTYVCDECGKPITIGLSGTEYGHQKGKRASEERCSKRPDCVDPNKPGGNPALTGD